MNTPVVMMVIALLVLLFMKVPVFASVLGASIVYFVMSPGITRPCSRSRRSRARKALLFWRSRSLYARVS